MNDDEITRDVDPSWLARLRADASSNGHHRAPTEAAVDGEADGGVDREADEEHTIGNADLLEQVRAAVRDARDEQATPRPSPGPVALSFPPPDPTSPVHRAKAAPIVTSPQARWQPPPRLKPAGPAPAPALLKDASRPARSKRVIVMAVTAAVIAALVAGVIIGRSGSSDPTPGDDTEVTTGGTTTGSSQLGSTTVATEVGS